MPPKKLRQTRLANVNSYVTVSTARGPASVASAPVKQKSLADCGFMPQPRASLQSQGEDTVYSPPSKKRRKLPSSFEIEETQLEEPVDSLQPQGLRRPQRDVQTDEDGDDGNQGAEGNEEEVIEGLGPVEEFSPHFLVLPINDNTSIPTLPASTSRFRLPIEVPPTQNLTMTKEERVQKQMDTGGFVFSRVVGFAHHQARSPVQSIFKAVFHPSEPQSHKDEQRKIPSSQEWENEDTQSKMLSTQASSQGDVQVEITANRDGTAFSSVDSAPSQPDYSSNSTHKPICTSISNARNKVRSSQSNGTSGTQQSDSRVGNHKFQSIEVEVVHAKSMAASIDEPDTDGENFDLDRFEFKPVQTQQLPSSLLVPQSSPRTTVAKSLSGSPSRIKDEGEIRNNEEYDHISKFSQLLPETLMDTCPMPPPLSSPDSYDSESDTE